MSNINILSDVKGQNETILDMFLRSFAKKYSKDKNEWFEKYGTDFENDKFMMHRFCWCEKDTCKWCVGEIIPSLLKGVLTKEIETMPNFWYKPLDFKVWWYKYIGRGIEVNKELSNSDFNKMVLDSGIKLIM